MADPDPEPRKTYHHGNLRQALVAATLKLIEEKGPLGFTLAEAARDAGVSAAAPYRHFRGRDELIEEVARQGFAMFADRLERAWNDGRPSALSAFMATGRAYLDFAREQPRLLHGDVRERGRRSPATPSSRAPPTGRCRCWCAPPSGWPRTCRPTAGRRPAMVANHVWAFSHGVVELFARGRPGGRAPYSAEEMLESGTGIYLRGLGVIPG